MRAAAGRRRPRFSSRPSTLCVRRGNDVFPAFRDFIKSSDAEEKEKEAALVAALTKLNEHLAVKGPYVGGEAVSATDCSLMPKLYHMKVATKHFKVGGLGAQRAGGAGGGVGCDGRYWAEALRWRWLWALREEARSA